MSESPAKSGTRPAASAGRPGLSPLAVVEFAAEKARDDLSFESLPAVLERFASAFGGRAALALHRESRRLRADHPQEPSLWAAYMHIGI